MTSEPVALEARAKINLSLHVTGQRPDGYHLLDSLVAFASAADRVELRPGSGLRLEITGPFASGVPTDRSNVLWQAAKLAGIEGPITLHKKLPHGAGIGGGSADAAALLRHAGVTKGASDLGADVPVCIVSAVCRMQGIGDRLTPLAPLPDVHCLLVNPGVALSTPRVFSALEQKENPPMPEMLPRWQSAAELIDWLGGMRNDLEPAAARMEPVIGKVLDALAEHSRLVRMSGSGSTCFGLFETATAADHAAARIGADHPDWWLKASTLN
jgi:4-diphosphocytidyl-2-C-methyl-D-erythritol kinase